MVLYHFKIGQSYAAFQKYFCWIFVFSTQSTVLVCSLICLLEFCWVCDLQVAVWHPSSPDRSLWMQTRMSVPRGRQNDNDAPHTCMTNAHCLYNSHRQHDFTDEGDGYNDVIKHGPGSILAATCDVFYLEEVNLRLAKCPLKTNGCLANLELTSLVKRPLLSQILAKFMFIFLSIVQGWSIPMVNVLESFWYFVSLA